MLKKFYLYYLILGIPKFYLITLILLIKNIFEKKFNLISFYKSKFHLLFFCLSSFFIFDFIKLIFFKDFFFENLKGFYVYFLLLISIFYFQNYNLNKTDTINLIFKVLIFYFLYILSIILTNNLVLDCYISKAGYYDLFQVINSKFVIFNYKEYNCEINNPYSFFSHITSLQFKITLLGFIGFLIIFNSKKKTYTYFSLFVILFCQIALFELGSRGLFFLLQILNIIVFIYFIVKKKFKILILYFISIALFFFGLIKNYEKSFVNIFYPNELSFQIKFLNNSNYDYKYWYSEDLYQRYLNYKFSKSRLDLHETLLNKKNLTIEELNLLNQQLKKKFFKNDKSYTNYFYTDRFGEYKLFLDFVLNKKSYDDIKNEKRYFHNYFKNLIFTFGFSSIILIIFYILFFLPFLLTFFEYKSSILENKLTSLIVLLVTIYFFNADAYFNVSNNFLILFTLLCFLIKNLIVYERKT